MKNKQKNIKKIVILSALAGALIAPWAVADAKPNGKVEVSFNDDKKSKEYQTTTIRIYDPDGVKFYSIYEPGKRVYDKEAKKDVITTWDPMIDKTYRSGDCKDTVLVKLDKKHFTHSHRVVYQDCKKPPERETWIVDPTNNSKFQPGNRTKSEISDGKFKLETTAKQEFGFRVEQLSNDTIPDMVITTENETAVGVAVMKGNGDGSFQQPSVEQGTYIVIPKSIINNSGANSQ